MNASDHDPAHRAIIDQLGAFLDEELAPEEAARVEAHLADCARCRADLALQRRLRDRLAALPATRAPAALRSRVEAVPERRPARPGSPESDRHGSRTAAALAWSRPVARVVPWLGWALAASLAVVLVVIERPAPPALAVPMVQAALSDYRAVAGRELPLAYAPDRIDALREVLPFPVTTLPAGKARLLGAWRTEIRGEPAAALAYRAGNDVVIQYVVSEALFFRQPLVRESVARKGRYVATDGGQAVVAWPGHGSGSLVIGALPPGSLERLVL